MGGEGHMIEMNRRLKANRDARRSQRDRYKKGDKQTYLSSMKLKFKTLSEDELDILKSSIRQRQKKRSHIQLLILLIALILIMLIWNCIF